uniref:AraC family transcriptional regulator n=1 Tax=Streptomyces hawaiiensis TaxID=67305 RepID=UPI003CD0A17D
MPARPRRSGPGPSSGRCRGRALGFADPAHFSHAFKAAYGMSPREARAARR